jgi:hypothetical protein
MALAAEAEEVLAAAVAQATQVRRAAFMARVEAAAVAAARMTASLSWGPVAL